MDITLGTEAARPPALRALARLAAFVAATAVTIGLILTLVLPRVLSGHRAYDPDGPAARAFEDRTGIHVVRVAVTGGGGLVDLRYQVVNADRALILHEVPPRLVDEDTGEVIGVPFMGHLHGGEPEFGLTYPLLFVNEGGALRPGDTVTIVVGGARLEHVPVR
jgi:hypothetical protein